MNTLATTEKRPGTWLGSTLEFPGGWAGDLAWSDDALWLAWAACADEEPDLMVAPDKLWDPREGVTLDEWRRRSSSTSFTVSMARLGANGPADVRELGRSLHAGDGPALAALSGESQPVAVWMERQEEGTAVLASVGGTVETVSDAPGAKLGPRVAAGPDGRMLVVWQQWPGDGTERGVPLITGAERGTGSGRRWGAAATISPEGQSAWAPAVAAGPDGGMWCAWDAWDGTAYQVYARHAPHGDDWGDVVQLSTPDSHMYLNLGPDVVAEVGRAWVAWSQTTPWGVLNHRFNHFRSLHARVLTADDAGRLSLAPVPGGLVHGVPGQLPVHAEPFSQRHTLEIEYMSPQAPRVRLDPTGNPVVFYRQFHRQHGQYDRGWATSALRHTGEEWSVPKRLSDQVGFPDSQYGVAPSGPDGAGWVVAAHAGVSPPEPPGNPVGRNRLMVEGVELSEPLVEQQPSVHYDLSMGVSPLSGKSGLETSVRELTVGARTYDLLYGDLHRHTAYSPCMAAVDGDPLDNWRWAADVEELDFYAITDHLEALSYVQWRRVEDLAETLAANGRVLPLLGFELGIPPGHTNFFYVDQSVGHDLRIACLSSVGEDVRSIWKKLDAWVPAGKVLAIRHYHTGTHQGDDLIDTYAPKYERVVEVIQTRYESPQWVQSLWRKGFRVGVVGSSDHSKIAPFAKVLTGLWLPEGERSRKSVLEGLRARRTFATNGVKMGVLLTASGGGDGAPLVMGDEGKLDGAPRLTANVSGTRPLERVEFYRNEQLLHVEQVGAAQATVEYMDEDAQPGEHIYWVKVVQPAEREGSRPNYGVAYSSPIWATV